MAERERAWQVFLGSRQAVEEGDISTWNLAPPPFPIPERELAIYAGRNFTLLRPASSWKSSAIMWTPGRQTRLLC